MLTNNGDNRILSPRLDDALGELKMLCGATADLNIIRVKICSVDCAVVTVEGLVSTSSFSRLWI